METHPASAGASALRAPAASASFAPASPPAVAAPAFVSPAVAAALASRLPCVLASPAAVAPAVAFAAAFAPGAFPRACVHSSVNVLPIDVSAAAPNGDGLDHIDSANVSAQICASSHGRGPGQPSVPLTPCASVCFTIFHLNPRGLRCPPQNLAKVDALLCSLNTPDFVAITETQLDLGTAVCCLSGYHVVSRLDRRQGLRTDAGCIAFFVREGLQDSVVHIQLIACDLVFYGFEYEQSSRF